MKRKWKGEGEKKKEVGKREGNRRKKSRLTTWTKQTSNKHPNGIYQMNEALSMHETDHKNAIVHR